MDDRVLAGVCGGLGEKLGMDPVVLRVAFVVLTAVWGLGLVLYGFVWFVVPVVDSPTTNPVPIGARGGVVNAVGLLVVTVAGLITLGTLDLLPRGTMLYPFVLLAVGVVLLWGRRPLRPLPRPALGPAPVREEDPAPPPPPEPEPRVIIEEEVSGLSPDEVWARFVAAHPPSPRSPGSDGLADDSGREGRRRGERRPVPLGTLTGGFLLVTAGLVYLGRRSGAVETSWVTFAALGLVLVGAVLVVGGWLGRPGGLTGIGVALTLFLVVATVVQVPLVGGLGRRDPRPLDISEVVGGYNLAGGTMVLDLTALSLDRRALEVTAGVAFGDLRVVLPPGTAVSVEARTGLGGVDLLGDRGSGMAVERTFTSGDFAVGVPRFVIRADVGVGHLTVEWAS